MNLEFCITQLTQHAQVIEHLTLGVEATQAVWKPSPSDWSILEVINHLYDEEREDFRAHLDAALHRPTEPWARIDPQGWVTARRYNERHLAESVQNFKQERAQSLIWLRELKGANWETTYTAPFGPIRAGDLLAAWVAHDILHLRQLVELHWAYANQMLHPYSVRYAGDW